VKEVSRHRIFCSHRRLKEGCFTVAGDEAHHAVTVLRLKPGNDVYVFTEQGSEFHCRVVRAGRGQLRAEIVEKLGNEVEPPLELILIQALPKAAKMEQIIVHGTELGLTRLVPVVTQRSLARGDRRDRWSRLALEATKQCGRRRIPAVDGVVELEGLDLGQFSKSLCLVAAEPPNADSLKEILAGRREVSSVAIAVGPEGGLTPNEFAMLLEAGFLPFSMGPRILRTQTASLAALASIQYELGDWDLP
jgi:16S rRNA (uracil1498-N3)-methyltransferase